MLQKNLKYPPNVTREKVSGKQRKMIEDWWYEVTVAVPYKATTKYDRKTKTHTTGPYYSQHDTDLNLFHKFHSMTSLNYCYNTVMRCKPKTIHLAQQQYCICHHCRDGRNKIIELATFRSHLHKDCQNCSLNEDCAVEKNMGNADQETLQTLQDEIQEYRDHKCIADHQSKKFQEAKESLKDGECVVVMDFAGRFIVQACLEMSQADYFARVGVPDLVCYIYYREDGVLKHKCFDIISKSKEKDDYAYFRSAWLQLLNNETIFDQFHSIHLFTDGGPKHFKIRKSLYFMTLLNAYYPQRFTWSFFQSCHGKGPCDGHGDVKDDDQTRGPEGRCTGDGH